MAKIQPKQYDFIAKLENRHFIILPIAQVEIFYKLFDGQKRFSKDPAHYKKLENGDVLMDLIDRIINRTISRKDDNWGMDINRFDWTPGVGLYGFYKAYEATGREYVMDFLKNWIANNIKKAYSVKTVNSTMPLNVVLKTYKITGEEYLLNVCKDIGEYIINEAPRTCERGLEHTVTEPVKGFSGQIWADTLFMSCIFLADLYTVTKNSAYKDEALYQLVLHYKRLWDESTGLFYHGYNYESNNWMSGAKWGRANAWIMVATFEILSHITEDFEGKEYVLKTINEHAKALFSYQRSNGMFGTLLDHEDSYDEASCTAGFAYATKRGVNMGYLPPECEEISKKAVSAVRNSFNDEGELTQVSSGTPIMPTLDHYKQIKTHPALYGQGLGLMAIL